MYICMCILFYYSEVHFNSICCICGSFGGLVPFIWRLRHLKVSIAAFEWCGVAVFELVVGFRGLVWFISGFRHLKESIEVFEWCGVAIFETYQQPFLDHSELPCTLIWKRTALLYTYYIMYYYIVSFITKYVYIRVIRIHYIINYYIVSFITIYIYIYILGYTHTLHHVLLCCVLYNVNIYI